MATPGPARRSVRSPGDLVEIAALTLALTAAGTTVPAGASADAGPLVASSGAVAAETTNSGVRGPSESRDPGGEEDARGANIQTQGAVDAGGQGAAPAQEAAQAQQAAQPQGAPAQQAAHANAAPPANARGQGRADGQGSRRGSGGSKAGSSATESGERAERARNVSREGSATPQHPAAAGGERDRPASRQQSPNGESRPRDNGPRQSEPRRSSQRRGDRTGAETPRNDRSHDSVPGREAPVAPSASAPPVRPIVVSQATLSRLGPTAAVTATRVWNAPPRRPGLATERLRIGAAYHRPAADVLSVAPAARSSEYNSVRRVLAHRADAARATTDAARFAAVGFPVPTAPPFVVVPSLTLHSDHRRLATPQDDPAPTTGRATRVAPAAALTTRAGRSIRDALAAGMLVALVVSLVGSALTRARVWFIARREAARGPVEFSTAAFGTAIWRVDVAQLMTAVDLAEARPTRERSSADRSTRRQSARPVALAPAAPASPVVAEAGRPRCPRHRPWHTDEITAGLVIGCRLAEERNAALTQRLLRRLAQEDPRIPSWSVVDRAARNAGETGGTWLQEARRRHRQAGKLQAVPGADGD